MLNLCAKFTKQFNIKYQIARRGGLKRGCLYRNNECLICEYHTKLVLKYSLRYRCGSNNSCFTASRPMIALSVKMSKITSIEVSGVSQLLFLLFVVIV